MSDALRPLRILIGHLGEPDPNSGAAGTNYAVAAALRAAGHEVTEIWQADVRRRIAHHALYYAAEAPRAIEAAVGRHLQTQGCDIVDFSQPHAYRAARHVRMHFPATRFVHFSHGFEGLVEAVHARHALPEVHRPWWRRLGSVGLGARLRLHQRWIARWAHGHVVSSSACAEYLRTQLSVDGSAIAVLPQAPSPAFLGPVDTASVRASGVLYVGQFAWIKAPQIVAQVFQRLSQQRKLRLMWICDQRHHDEVRALLGDAAERVELAGWVSQTGLAALMSEFSILLFPSYFEGYGKVFIEAMARGMCVVATRVGGMRDQIQHGVNGMLTEVGDVDALVGACVDLLASPERTSEMGARARALASRCTWQQHAERRSLFYRQLLAGPAHAP